MGEKVIAIADRPWGWQGRRTGLVNSRPPALPIDLAHEMTLEDYYAAAALIGILAAQHEEPNHDWACQSAIDMGNRMASTVRQRKSRRMKATKKP